jgi:hypothetical protein
MSAGDIDIERAIWDADYRRVVIAYLNGVGALPANQNAPPADGPGSLTGDRLACRRVKRAAR